MTEAQQTHEEEINNPLELIFADMMSAEDEVFRKAIQGLAKLPSMESVKLKPMAGKPFPKKPYDRGVMGFRRLGRNLTLAVGCGRAMVRQIVLSKFIAMVQCMDNDQDATIVLENFVEGEDGRMPRGQVLGRIIPEYSALVVAQGLTGRVIHTPSDIVKHDCYYLNKEVLTGFYISSKLQQGSQELLDELSGAYDGWLAYRIPRNPCEPEV